MLVRCKVLVVEEQKTEDRNSVTEEETDIEDQCLAKRLLREVLLKERTDGPQDIAESKH